MKKTTKEEQILNVALSLFAEKGFDGVGIDEIGTTVGIKGPSLYYYFKGKQAILDGIIDRIERYYQEGFEGTGGSIELPSSLENFIDMSLKRLTFTLHDERIKQMRKFLIKEQFRNARLSYLASLHQLTYVERINEQCILHLQSIGALKAGDARMLAFEFTSPVSLLIQIIDREPEKEQELMERIRQHMQHFENVYGVQ